jgi:hypothetical protein
MKVLSEQSPRGIPGESQKRDEDHRWRAALHLLQYRLHKLGIDSAGFKRDGTFVMAQRCGRPLTTELNMIESGSRTGKLCDWEIASAGRRPARVRGSDFGKNLAANALGNGGAIDGALRWNPSLAYLRRPDVRPGENWPYRVFCRFR